MINNFPFSELQVRRSIFILCLVIFIIINWGSTFEGLKHVALTGRTYMLETLTKDVQIGLHINTHMDMRVREFAHLRTTHIHRRWQALSDKQRERTSGTHNAETFLSSWLWKKLESRPVWAAGVRGLTVWLLWIRMLQMKQLRRAQHKTPERELPHREAVKEVPL